MTDQHTPIHVTLVAIPDSQISPLSGLFETLNAFVLLSNLEPDIPPKPFRVEIVVPNKDSGQNVMGLPAGIHYEVDAIKSTEIVIVPLMMVRGPDWVKGRYPDIVDWLAKMHRNGAILCSACTGVLLLAETGLLDGHEATIHWAFAPTFQRNFPKVRLRTKEVLITAGDHQEFVMTGGVMSWHDLALHLIARFVGPTAAQSMARLLMLQWHADGQAPYISFSPNLGHGDALIVRIQKWLESHYMVANPVDEMVSSFGLARRSLGRRFKKATGYSPIGYVQNLRIAEARRRLERTEMPVEEVAYQVGYENIAFFRRVFRRTTRLTPALYRRKFQMPNIQTLP